MKRKNLTETPSGRKWIPLPKEYGTDLPEEWMLSVKPDYARVRALYLRICLFASIVLMLFQIALLFVFEFKLLPLEYKTSRFVHMLKYFILPSIVNYGVTLFAWLMHRNYKKNELLLNTIPIFAITVICTSAASAHQVYSITLMLFALPPFMASIYGQPRMLGLTSAANAVGIAVAIFCRVISPYRQDSLDTKLIPEAVAAYVVLFVATAISLVMIALLNTQKGKLISATREAMESRKQAQAANQAKSEFLANMSHEIRTPLNAVIGLTEMISRRSTEQEILEYAGDIQQASNALLSIINDILDISKIESGKVEMHETNYELGSLINDSYNMVSVRLREKGLTAEVTCDPSLPRMLCGDEYHLRQIIVNLLSNAVKYTNEGGIEMRVSGEENSDILRMEVTVKDSGVGIKAEDFEKLFNKFSRLDYSRNRKIEGAGLGLSITKQLVELMNGTISVESVYGVGSTFTVRVPQKIVDRTPIGDIHRTYMDMHGDIDKYHQSFEAPDARLLIVDDMPINLQVLRKLLEATKMTVDTVTSGRECLEKVRDTNYDLILMDHMMPELDGVDTLKAMNAMENSLNRDTPVIMLTANAMLGAREEYLEAGFVDYLAKPVRGARLERMILRYLPADKVRIYTEEEERPVVSVPFSLDLLREKLPEVDVRSGIAYCADDENFYQTMLNEFAGSNRDMSLEAHFMSEEWPDYQIDAHSLKSAARMVGFTALSDESYGLEDAAKRGDADYIRQHHAQVVDHYRRVAATLKEILH